MNPLERRVADVIAYSVGLDLNHPKVVSLTRDSNIIHDLEVDSIGFMEAVISIEEHFGIDVSREESDKIRNIGELSDYISRNQKYNSEVLQQPYLPKKSF